RAPFFDKGPLGKRDIIVLFHDFKLRKKAPCYAGGFAILWFYSLSNCRRTIHLGIEVFHLGYEYYLNGVRGLGTICRRLLQRYIDLGYTAFEEVIGYGYHPALFERPGAVVVAGTVVDHRGAFRVVVVVYLVVYDVFGLGCGFVIHRHTGVCHGGVAGGYEDIDIRFVRDDLAKPVERFFTIGRNHGGVLFEE